MLLFFYVLSLAWRQSPKSRMFRLDRAANECVGYFYIFSAARSAVRLILRNIKYFLGWHANCYDSGILLSRAVWPRLGGAIDALSLTKRSYPMSLRKSALTGVSAIALSVGLAYWAHADPCCRLPNIEFNMFNPQLVPAWNRRTYSPKWRRLTGGLVRLARPCKPCFCRSARLRRVFTRPWHIHKIASRATYQPADSRLPFRPAPTSFRPTAIRQFESTIFQPVPG